MTRRHFLCHTASFTAGMTLLPQINTYSASNRLGLKEARYYIKRQENQIQCRLCPWQCVVDAGKRGKCEVRENRDGEYYSLVYGRIATYHNDPIEKKPLYHFLPASLAFSIATAGCNVECKFCQNWELAQRRPEELQSAAFTPKEIVDYAERLKCKTIAYTYNEPTIFYEYLYDIASIGKNRGIRSVLVSNGFINQKPLVDLCSTIDGYKVDLKAFSEEYYREVVNGRLKPVLDTLITLKREGVWTEIVYLVVPTLNDNVEDLKKLAKWIYQELGPDVPLHFSRFYPKYKLKNLPPTPIHTLETAREIGLDAGLHYVYMGNVPGHAGGNTNCPNCGKTLIGRLGYQLSEHHVVNGECEFCGQKIAGVWT